VTLVLSAPVLRKSQAGPITSLSTSQVTNPVSNSVFNIRKLIYNAKLQCNLKLNCSPWAGACPGSDDNRKSQCGEREREVVLAFPATKVGTGKKRSGWEILNESPIMPAKSGQFSLLLTASSCLSWLYA